MDTDTEEFKIIDPWGDGTPNFKPIPWYLQPLKDPRFNPPRHSYKYANDDERLEAEHQSHISHFIKTSM
jgi:hypothetical protein